MKQKLKWIFNNLERILVISIFLIILLTIFIQIVSRWFFNSPLFFTEELARYLFLWMIFLGFSYAIIKGKCLSLNLAAKKFSVKQRCIFDIIINVLSVGLFIFLGYWSIQYIQFVWPNPAPAMRISMGIVYMVAPISMLMCIGRSIGLIFMDVKRLMGKLPFLEKS